MSYLSRDDLIKKFRSVLRSYPEDDSSLARGCDIVDDKLSDSELFDVVYKLVVEGIEAISIVSEYFSDLDDDAIDDVVYALNRLSVHAVSVKSAVKGASQENKPVKADQGEMVPISTFSDGDFLTVLKECQVSLADSSPADDLAVLLEIQKRRVLDLLKEATRSPKGHLMLSKKLNEAVRIYFEMLHKAAYLQMDLGIKSRSKRREVAAVERAFNEIIDIVGDDASGVAQLAKAIAEVAEKDSIKRRIGKGVAKSNE